VVLDVELGRFFVVMRRVQVMTVGHMRVVGGLFVIALFVVFSGLFVVFVECAHSDPSL
jgi:hypothetical protein